MFLKSDEIDVAKVAETLGAKPIDVNVSSQSPVARFATPDLLRQLLEKQQESNLPKHTSELPLAE